MDISTIKKVQTGIMFLRSAIHLFLAALLLAAGAAGILFITVSATSLKAAGVAGLLSIGALMLGGLVAFIGKIFCLQSTVGRNLILGSLALDAVAFFTRGGSLSNGLWLVSFGLILAFFFFLGDALGSPSVIARTVAVAGCSGMMVGTETLGSLLGWSWLGLVSFVFAVLGLFAYLALLSQTVSTLEDQG